jgi:hypothetical protein
MNTTNSRSVLNDVLKREEESTRLEWIRIGTSEGLIGYDHHQLSREKEDARWKKLRRRSVLGQRRKETGDDFCCENTSDY